ncbi:GATA zinc finger domain-containing protein 14-like isoform X2 [Phoenix dactylifera]|uniref:GATA zinc finger domain-containing protein 14-like isoform X2 n=1 Tax=Phoenix dactylifera TaxID=42345 RepID=A0A8B7MUT5_PHODC|nr:GATA zinc finger domain-containing protein 14-like isoform X2 [Phoenix dactylifera]
MLLQSNSRYQRSKGSKVKNIVQVTVLLVVAIWLLYRIKHSDDKNNGYTENDGNELSNGAGEIHLGRKAKAGSENVIVIDNHVENFEETSETKEAGGGLDDALSQHPDDKGEEAIPIKEHEEPRADITDTETTGSKQEQQGSEDNNADSHINGGEEGAGDGTDEAIEEVIRLHSQKDTDNSFDQNENRDGRDDSIEENVLPKDDHVVEKFLLNGATSDNGEATSSDEEGLSTSQTETSEIVELNSEHLETDGELSDKAMAEAARSSKSSLSEDQSNVDASTSDEFHKKVDVESKGTIASDAEISGRNEVGDVSLPSEENDAASTNDDTPERKTTESQGDNTGAEKTEESDTRSKDEITNSLNSAEDNNEVVMPTNKETPKTEAVESDNSILEAVTGTGSDDELAKSSLASEQNNVEVESHGDKASHVEVTPKNVHEEENSDSKSNDELANSSHASEDKNVDKPANGEATDVDAGESQDVNANEAEINGNGSTEETKSETTSNNEAAHSSDSNEQKSSGTPNSVTPDGEAIESRDVNVDREGNRELSDVNSESQIINVTEDEHNGNGSAEVTATESISNNEAANSSHKNEQNSSKSVNGESVESQGDGVSEAETTSNSAQDDTKIEPYLNNETSSELGNNVVLSSNNVNSE